MKRALGLLLVLLSPAAARADTLVELRKGTEVVADMEGTRRHLLGFRPRADRKVHLDALLQVAPGGAVVAAANPETRELAVFRASGEEVARLAGAGAPFRFSADGMRLAYVAGGEVREMDVATGVARRLARVGEPDVIRWTGAGWLVARCRPRASWIKHVSPSGEVTTVRLGGRLDAIAAAAEGGRVVTFAGAKLQVGSVEMTIDDPSGVVDAEISPDGTRVLFATKKKVYLLAADKPAVIAEDPTVHSVGFSTDGASYVWASRRAGAVVAGDAAPVPVPRGAVAVRFRGDAPGLVVTTDTVGFWDPTSAALTLAGGISADEGLNLAAEVVSGGKVVSLFLRRNKTHRPPRSPAPE